MEPPETAATRERALILAYAPTTARAGLNALLGLDGALAAVMRSTREPAIGQMRLAWWHDALTRLDDAPPPAMPVLTASSRDVLPHGITGAGMAAMIDGWDVLVEAEALDDTLMLAFAHARGGGLFALAATILRLRDDRIADAGAGWALADLANGLRDRRETDAARALALPFLDRALRGRWPVAGRALGAMAHLARMDVAPVPVGPARRIARIGWHRLTGR